MKAMVSSPLRYPGGKSRGVDKILSCFPEPVSEYREPFVGGGSVFIAVRQRYPGVKVWINDLNPEVYAFWTVCKRNLAGLILQVQWARNTKTDGRELFKELATADVSKMTELDRAARFFVLNRITFSGTIEAGGYSGASFSSRFTQSSIDRLRELEPVMDGVRVTGDDYKVCLSEPGDNVVIYLDPPYYGPTKSRLYGNKGVLHTGFNHTRFSADVAGCSHRWVVSYDDCEVTRNMFSDFRFVQWELQYGMNNYKQGHANKGKEVLILNY